MRRLTTDEMRSEIKTTQERIDVLTQKLQDFKNKFDEFHQAWQSENANRVKNNIENMMENLNKSKNNLTTIYNKIQRTTANIERANEV